MIRVFLLWVGILAIPTFIYSIGNEVEENKKEKKEKEMENEKITIIQIMKDRMFELVNVNVDEKKFIFLYKGSDEQRDKIICEVDSKHEYKFIFTCEGMCGILDSGLYNEFQNSNYFESRITAFTETVCVLKRYYEVYE